MRSAVTVTLPVETLDALDGYARERNLPRSYATQEILERMLTINSERRPRLSIVPSGPRLTPGVNNA